MKSPGPALVVAGGLFLVVAAARGDTDSPVDYTRRNEAFAPVAPLPAARRGPESQRILRETPKNFRVLPPEPSDLGERRAAIEVGETHAKTIVSTAVAHPRPAAPELSALDRRPAAISTTGNAVRPPLVDKYQSGLRPAGEISIGRLPALSGDATATFNRFVFRHNNPVPNPGAAVPAAGGAGK